MPALLTTICGTPSSATMAAMALATLAASVTSIASGAHVAGPLNGGADLGGQFAPSSMRRPAIATFAPCAASTRAKCRPKPLQAPVTRAVRVWSTALTLSASRPSRTRACPCRRTASPVPGYPRSSARVSGACGGPSGGMRWMVAAYAFLGLLHLPVGDVAHRSASAGPRAPRRPARRRWPRRGWPGGAAGRCSVLRRVWPWRQDAAEALPRSVG